MNNYTIFLLSLLTLVAMQKQTHALKFLIINKASNTTGGIRFNNEIGEKYTHQTLISATEFIWRVFNQTITERKNIHKVSLIIESMEGIAYTENNEIHLSANYTGEYSGDVKKEVTGIVYHEMTHVWQWSKDYSQSVGLIEGIADFVRLRSYYGPAHWVKQGGGKNWDDGYDVTARFLDYCNCLRDGFVGEINRMMKNGYSVSYFDELLGKNVDQLWSEYKAQYVK